MTAKTTITATLAFVLLASAGASADHHGMKGFDPFSKADANQDGAVSEAELTAALRSHFDEFDTNKDGKIVLSELPQEMPLPEGMQEKMDERYQQMVEKRGQDKADKMKERFSKRFTRVDFMSRLDDNGDEAISFEEFAEKPMKHFKKADANGDGIVTEAEKDVAMEKMHDRMKERGHDKWWKRGDSEQDKG